jgi:hypothetical protein
MHEYLSSVSLADLVAQQAAKPPVAVLHDKRPAEKVAA